VQRKHDRDRDRQEQVDEQPQSRRVVDVAGAMRGREHVLAGRDPRALERALVGRRARLEEQCDIDHDVADQVHAAGDVLASKVFDRRLGRAQKEVGQMIGRDPIELLGHRAVE
jgi:hypothetical protein